jgi:hypothetical protein
MLLGIAVFTAIGNVKTAAFENDRSRMDNAPRLTPALRAHRYRLFVKALFPLKTKLALAALIFVNRHVSPHALLKNILPH